MNKQELFKLTDNIEFGVCNFCNKTLISDVYLSNKNKALKCNSCKKINFEVLQ